MKRPRTRIMPGNWNHGNDYERDYAWNFNHNDDEPEQWWNWQWHCLNISICQWRIEHISENILLKSVPQRVICSCTAWSVGFTCIENYTLISKQIFSWGVRGKYWGFSWCSHATMIKITILWYYDVTAQHAGFKFFVQQDSSSLQENTFFFKLGKGPKLFTIHNFWITVLGSSSPAASLTVPVILS